MKSKILRKILSVSLAAAMMTGVGVASSNVALNSSISATAVGLEEDATSGDFTYRVSYYDSDSYAITIVKYNGTDTEVVIPSSMKVSFNQQAQTLPVVYIGSKAFQNNTELESVTIPDSVKSIGSYAFAGCKNLSDVTIPGSVTSMSEYAFSECDSLTVVDIPESMTYVPPHCFFKCSNLSSVTLPSTIKSINSWAFMYCTSIEEIEFPDGLTDIGYFAFCGCTALNSIILPDTVKSLGGSAFQQCTGVETLKLSSGLTSIGNDFGACTGLTSVSIPSSVTSMESAFKSCTGLESVTIPTSVTNIGRECFEYCSGLTSIKIPNSVKTIGSMAFAYCNGLTSVTLPISVTEYNPSAFTYCKNLIAININANNRNYASVNGVVFNKDKTTLLEYPYAGEAEYTVPEGVTEIGAGAFYDNEKLTEITLPSTLEKISETAFGSCDNITSVVIPNKVTEIGYGAFANCSNLEEITIPKSVTYIDSSAFAQCPALVIIGKEGSYADEYATNMDIPFVPMEEEPFAGIFCEGSGWERAYVYIYYGDGDNAQQLSGSWPGTAMTKIGNGVFVYPIETSIPDGARVIFSDGGNINRFPKDMEPGYLYAQGGYYKPSGMDHQVRPSEQGTCGDDLYFTLSVDGTLEIFGTGAMDDYAISGDNTDSPFNSFRDKVNKVVIGEGVTHIGTWAFFKCPIKDGITLPSTLESIGDYAFVSAGFSTIALPSGLTSIGQSAFAENTTLKSLTIPEGITEINGICYGCTKLASVTLPETLETIGDITFLTCTSLMRIVVPESVTTIGEIALGYNRWIEKHTGYQIGHCDPIDGFTIVGYEGSEAQTYAENHGFTFELAEVEAELVNNSTISASSITFGKSATITASAEGGSGSYQYEYLYKLSTDSDFTKLKSYTSTATAKFTPKQSGTYTVRVNVKDSNGQIVPKDIKLTVKLPALNNNSTISASEINIGESVTVTAAATGGVSAYQYEILYKHTDDDDWSTLQNYSAETSAEFTPDKAGVYMIRINVKDSQNQVTPKNLQLTVTAASLVNNSTLSAAEITLGSSVEVKAAAEGGSGDYEYEILCKLSDNDKWATLKQYSAEASAEFTPDSAGSYVICVNVKDSLGQVTAKNFALTVKAVPLENTSALSATDVTLGNSIEVKASAKGGSGDYEYEILYKLSIDDDWSTLQEYSATDKATFKATSAGTYNIIVNAKDSSGKIVSKELTVNFKSMELTNTSSVSAEEIVLGDTVTINASAAGGAGSYEYKVTHKRTDLTAWTFVQDYDTNDTINIKFAKPGTYDVNVKVRDASNKVVTKTIKVTVKDNKLQNESYALVSTVVKGYPMTIKARATGSTGFYQYAVYYRKEGAASWTTRQGYSPNSNVVLSLSKTGTYEIYIKIKDDKNRVAKKTFSVEVVEPSEEFTNLSVLSSKKIKTGEGVIATAMACGGSGFYKYAFSSKLSDDDTWTVKQAYSPENEFIFIPAEAGTYDFRISIIDSNGSETFKDFSIEVG